MITLHRDGRGLEIGRLHYYNENGAPEGFHAWAAALIERYEGSGCKEVFSTYVDEYSQTVEITYRRKLVQPG